VRSYASQAGFAAAVLGTVLILQLAVARIVFTADDDLIYFLGRPIHVVCWVKQRWGVPCPACGGSRGFILALHGGFGQGWRISPLGPLAAIGMAAGGLALLVFSQIERRASRQHADRFRRWFATTALTYGVAATVICTVAWLSAVAQVRAG